MEGKAVVQLYKIMADRNIRYIEELHQMSGVSRTTISSLLNGKKVDIRLETIEKLCRALNCQVGELIVLTTDGQAV